MRSLVESRTGGNFVVNEDRYVCADDLPLHAVLDAEVHGGHAADVAIATPRARLTGSAALRDADLERVSKTLVECVQEANRSVFAASSTKQWRGCGTTFTGCVPCGHAIVVAQVGDSRLYLRRAGSWRLVTHDHALLEDARQHDPNADLTELLENHSNVITRALGFTPELVVDAYSVAVAPGGCPLVHGWRVAAVRPRLRRRRTSCLGGTCVAPLDLRLLRRGSRTGQWDRHVDLALTERPPRRHHAELLARQADDLDGRESESSFLRMVIRDLHRSVT
jgi:hypothetical protein